MALKDLITDYEENKGDIIKWTTLKGEYRYKKLIEFLKSNKIPLEWKNITNYMKYDKRILYNSFKYIVVLEELFKSMIAKNSLYREEDLLTMDFKTALEKLLSLNKKVEFEGIDYERLKKEKGAINSFRNAVAHNKMLLNRKFRGPEEYRNHIPGKSLGEVLDIYKQIIPESYMTGFCNDIYNSKNGLDINSKFIFLKPDSTLTELNPNALRMRELEKIIKYDFKNINLLEHAMNSTPLGNDNHINDALATVGDAILKSLIADFLYVNGSKLKGEITDLKRNLENNTTLHNVEMNTGIIKFAHNDKHFYTDENVPGNEQVVCREHDSYLEAIVGAIYYDSGFSMVKRWFMNYLYNELEKNKVIKRVESNNFVEEKND